MRAERFLRPPAAAPSGRLARLALSDRGGPEAVRRLLARTMAHPILAGEGEATRGTVEIVLAEALNNIVEHAYRDGAGAFSLRGRWYRGTLCLELRDEGRPLPDHRLPEGRPLDPAGDGDPPEGGFGWFLIRSLTIGLRYRRTAAGNSLVILLLPEQ